MRPYNNHTFTKTRYIVGECEIDVFIHRVILQTLS